MGVRLSLREVMGVLGVRQWKVQSLKSGGRLGPYTYGAYNDYDSDDVAAYLDEEIVRARQNLARLEAAKLALARLCEGGRANE